MTDSITTTRRAPNRDSDEVALAAVLRRLEHHHRVLDQRATVRLADMRLLWLLNDNRPRSLREISCALELEQSTVNRQVNTAVLEGLVRREREPGQPTYLFSRTEAGARAFESNMALGLDVYSATLAEFDAAERPLLFELLGRLVDAYGEAVHAGERDITAGAPSELG